MNLRYLMLVYLLSGPALRSLHLRRRVLRVTSLWMAWTKIDGLYILELVQVGFNLGCFKDRILGRVGFLRPARTAQRLPHSWRLEQVTAYS